MPALADLGRRLLREARLPADVEALCLHALGRPMRLFGDAPIWSRLFLTWLDALAAEPREAFDACLPAAVACEYMVAGYDLIDAGYDTCDGTVPCDEGASAGPGPAYPARAGETGADRAGWKPAVPEDTTGTGWKPAVPEDTTGTGWKPAIPGDSATDALALMHAGMSLVLLAQETLPRVAAPAERRERAAAALARAGRRALAAQRDALALPGTPAATLRGTPAATTGAAFAVLSRRSGALTAAPCQCAALLAGAHWRCVALAGRFGHALGCAAQLEDDLADRAEDARDGRATIPVLLDRDHDGTSDVVEAMTWVLIRRYLREAARTIERLPVERTRTEALWTLLPSSVRAA